MSSDLFRAVYCTVCEVIPNRATEATMSNGPSRAAVYCIFCEVITYPAIKGYNIQQSLRAVYCIVKVCEVISNQSYRGHYVQLPQYTALSLRSYPTQRLKAITSNDLFRAVYCIVCEVIPNTGSRGHKGQWPLQGSILHRLSGHH